MRRHCGTWGVAYHVQVEVHPSEPGTAEGVIAYECIDTLASEVPLVFDSAAARDSLLSRLQGSGPTSVRLELDPTEPVRVKVTPFGDVP